MKNSKQKTKLKLSSEEKIVLEGLGNYRRNLNAFVAIHELIEHTKLPVPDFAKAFISLYKKRIISPYDSSRMLFWKVSNEEWNRKDPPGDKYYAHRHGISELDRKRMMEFVSILKDNNLYTNWYFIDTDVSLQQKNQQ